jgi:RNA polymerase sigma-70 factor (ECF subfamily)
MISTDFASLNEKLTVSLAACANGDRRAFQTVYTLTAPKFAALLTSQLNDAEAAKDVMQQAYISIWRNAGKFDPAKGNPFTWMLVIMRNRGLDRLRSRARAPVTEMIEETIVDHGVQPEQNARYSHAGRLINKHLSCLPEHVSMSISLNVIQGMSCREIGQVLNVSPNTVKGWVRRGLKKLRHEMPVDRVDAVI